MGLGGLVDDSSTVVFAGGGTGGHFYPALALANELVNQRPEVRPVFIGASRGIESRLLPGKSIEYSLLPVRGWERGQILTNLGVPWALLKSFLSAIKLHKRYNSKLVIVTGGYSSAPAGLAAVMLGIPLVLQEQNAHPGVTTRVLSLWAKQIHVAFSEAISHLPEKARTLALISGCPIEPPEKLPLNRKEICEKFGLDPKFKVLLVTGGSQGSVALNDLILRGLQEQSDSQQTFFSKWQILWVAGLENYELLNREVNEIEDCSRIRVLPYVDSMPLVLKLADLAVSRAGAMTTSELLAWGVPAILIPLPTAAANHQELNALAIQEFGAALYMSQMELTASKFWAEIYQLTDDDQTLSQMASQAMKNSKPDATSKVVSSMLKLLPEPRGD
ncbi:MAG TPA: undecaprenyldiphospho-muramoylpentapeptide beta-N-acetylglucosaminyltransferase [Gemmatimonadetes bacterium]|nr:undecaprenyldiphospho-muramoylpentapeptide beta-N-acetylglucosaminyltransferase [Gemmatimonadota bacterium]